MTERSAGQQFQRTARTGETGLDSLLANPNILKLDEKELHVLAKGISSQGMNRDQLMRIYNEMLIPNYLLAIFVGNTVNEIRRSGGHETSYNRGVALAFYLIVKTRTVRPPEMDIISFGNAKKHHELPGALMNLQEASERLLVSQRKLSEAFDIALPGLENNTQPHMARFGAGILTLGKIAEANFDGNGIKVKSKPDQT